MADAEMAEDKPETSREGRRRMHRLASLPGSYQPSQHAAIQPETAQLIYTSPSAARPASISTIFTPLPPRLLPTPPIMASPSQISLGAMGDWLIAFHPSPPVPGLVAEGGTIAIYARSILDLTAAPGRTMAHATFSIPFAPLSTVHLYPPRSLDAAGKLSPQAGPRPPVGYSPLKGPAFVILTAVGAFLFAPDSQGTMGMLRAPVHTRWSASPGGGVPPDMDKHIDRGSLAILGEDGVWVAWSIAGQWRVTRLEVGLDRSGASYLRSTPMPTLPSLKPAGRDESIFDEGIAFVALGDENGESKPNGVQVNGHSNHGGGRLRIGAVAIQRLRTSEGNIKSRLCTIAFERRENEIAQGFTDLGGEDGEGRTWDWFTGPSVLHDTLSPPNISIVALHALPFATGTLAIAVLSSRSGLILTHLDLCKLEVVEGGHWKAMVGDAVPLPFGDAAKLELVLSPGVASGGLGLVGLVIDGKVTWVVSPRLHHAEETEDKGVAEEAAKSILTAIRQDVSYSDVIRAALGTSPKSNRSALAIEILSKVHEALRSQRGTSALEEIFRLQTALFRAAHDPRKTLSRELVQLCAARQILGSCSERSGNELSFELGSLWPLLTVVEWLLTSLASSFREVIALQGKLEWEEPNATLPTISRALYIVHPYIRFLLVDLLFYAKGYISFCLALDQSIAPPPNLRDPIGVARDPRVTVVLKDKVRDLEIKHGLEIDTWGKALTALNIKAGLVEDDLSKAVYTLSLAPIQPLVMPTLASLPSPSSLLLGGDDESVEYDVVSFAPLPPAKRPEGRSGLVSCDRCGGKSAILRDRVLAAGMGRGVNPSADEDAVWADWRRAGEVGCGCGGTWV